MHLTLGVTGLILYECSTAYERPTEIQRFTPKHAEYCGYNIAAYLQVIFHTIKSEKDNAWGHEIWYTWCPSYTLA